MRNWRRGLERYQRYLWIAVGVVLSNTIWLMLARYAGPSRAPQPRPAPYVRLGTGQPGVRILQFYAGAGEIVRGDSVIICYGVENAKEVRIEPPAQSLTPSFNRCISAEPQQTTRYTLWAKADDGEVSASFTVQVRPAPPQIEYVAVSGREVARGSPITVCAKLKNATAARLEPVGWVIPTGDTPACNRFYPVQTTLYQVLATGPGGRDSETFQIRVVSREQ